MAWLIVFGWLGLGLLACLLGASQGNPSGLARLAGLVPEGTFRQVSREHASQASL